MRTTLGFYPFFIAVMTVIAIVVLCLINMYLLARHKRNHITICIHIFSLFTVFSLIFYMMHVAVYPIAENYKILSIIFLFLAFATIFIGSIFAFLFEKKYSLKNLPHSIPDALKNIDDLVFVIDGEGTILHINHPEKFYSLFGNISTAKELYPFLKEHCLPNEKGVQSLNSISDVQRCEFYFDWVRTSVIFKVSPVVLGDRCLAYTAVLEDITAVRNTEKMLREQNEALILANERLSNYIIAAGKLEAEKEGLQILSQIQETIMIDIKKALPIIQEIKQNCLQDGSYQIVMKEFAAQLRQIYEKVRNTVGKIAGKEGKE